MSRADNINVANVSVRSNSIDMVRLDRTKNMFPQKTFSENIEILTPGDIFVLEDASKDSEMQDGLYLVGSKRGNSILAAKMDCKAKDVKCSGIYYGPDNVEGQCRIIGSLDVTA